MTASFPNVEEPFIKIYNTKNIPQLRTNGIINQKLSNEDSDAPNNETESIYSKKDNPSNVKKNFFEVLVLVIEIIGLHLFM